LSTTRRNVVSIGLGVLVVYLLFSGQATIATESPNVLIDLSHEFTFEYDAFLPVGYLEPDGYDITHSFETLSASTLDGMDILVIEQATTALTFDAEQIRAIMEFVQNGGGLLLVGKKWPWQPSPLFPSVTTYPINDVAAEFGCAFEDGYGAAPYQVRVHETTQGVTGFDTRGCTPGLLAVDASSTVLIADAAGNPVVAVREVGSGRVAMSAEDCFVSSPFTGEPLINVRLIENLFRWLSHGKTTRYPGQTPPARYLPENQQVEGTVTLYYTDTLGARAQFLVDNYPTVYGHLVTIMNVHPIFDFTFIALAAIGNGYSGGQEVGVGVLIDDSWVVRILAHELTHSFVEPGGLPGYAIGEGWASLAAIRVARQMGYAIEADAERLSFEIQFRSVDPDGTSLDLSLPIVTANGRAYMGKAMWVTESLEAQYGADLMARLMPLHRQWVQSGRASEPVTMDELIQMLSEIAEANLYPYFRSIGTLGIDSAAVFCVDERGIASADGTFYSSTFEAGAADLAEWISVSEPVGPGDVIEHDPLHCGCCRPSSTPFSQLVAGVVSTDPGVILGLDTYPIGQALLALTGIVPVKVTNEGGPIMPGDLLVTSSTPGHAMRWSGDSPCPCALVGKALEPMTETEGLVLVLLTAH